MLPVIITAPPLSGWHPSSIDYGPPGLVASVLVVALLLCAAGLCAGVEWRAQPGVGGRATRRRPLAAAAPV